MRAAWPVLSSIFLAAGLHACPALADPPFKLGVEQQGYLQDPLQGGAQSYPAPKMIQPAGKALQGTNAPIQGRAQDRQPLVTGVQERVVLPASFLGVWNVQGQRAKIEAASPEFQQQAEGAFNFNTSNIWEISGDPGNGYAMGSNTGIKTALTVDKVEGNTAFIRYQHPIGKTMAQEAIVMTLLPGGAQFNGLERVTIVKPNEPPRCRVTYQLVGRRQR